LNLHDIMTAQTIQRKYSGSKA